RAPPGAPPPPGRELPGRAPGLPLSDEGRRQAEAAAARIHALAHPPAPATAPSPPEGDEARGNGQGGDAARPKGPHITAVYASPLERTRETAAPPAGALR